MDPSTLPHRARLGFLLGMVLLVSLTPVRVFPQEGVTPLDRAKRSYEAGEYGKVITELEAALVHTSNYSAEELAEIYLYLGLSYQAFERTDRAEKAFAEALRLKPDLELAPGIRSPEVETTFEHARWEVEAEAAEGISEPDSLEVPLGQPIEVTPGLTGKTRAGGVWRSCLVPGWGQFYGNRTVRGYAFLTGEILALAAALYASRESDQAYDEYRWAEREGSMRAHSLYDDYDSSRKTRATLLVVAGGIWAVNVLESLLNDPSVPRDERAMGEWKVAGRTVGRSGWEVRLCTRF